MYRFLRDLSLAALVFAVIGGAMYFQRERREREALVQQVMANVRRLELEVKYQAATNAVGLNSRGWPTTVDPKWFGAETPRNGLVSPDRPWLEVASPDEAGLSHPPVRMAVEDELAAFWYNPYQGIVRARVPILVSDEQATTLYNQINGATIPSIFFRETPQLRPDNAKDLVAPVEAAPIAEEPKAGHEFGPPSVTVKRKSKGMTKSAVGDHK